MAGEAERRVSHDPAARGHDGRLLSPVDPPAPGDAPSPAWLAQLGRAPIGEYAHGREVVKRLTEDGLAVPGDDPLYQYLGAHRVFVEVLKAQHEDQLGRMRAMLDEARQGLTQLLTDVDAAGGTAVGARRVEDEAVLRRLSAELENRAVEATRKLHEAMADERNATTAAVAVAVAEALARIDSEKSARAGRGRPWRRFTDLMPAWAVRGRQAAAWAALLVLSVIAGLVVLWVLGLLGPGHGRR
jgi:hypothetical protein